MVVVSNTSPLIYLTKIGNLNLLQSLFKEVIVADKVYEEVVIQGAGMPGADEVKNAHWIRRQSVSDKSVVQKLQDENLIDAGEAETLVLAQELKADLTLIDDRKARKLAARMKVKRIGTLAIILMAYKKDLIQDLPSILNRVRQKAFGINAKVFDRLKQR